MTGAVGGCWQERWELSQGKGLVTGSLGLSTYGLGWDEMAWDGMDVPPRGFGSS